VGTLRHTATGTLCFLESEHVVGRSPRTAMLLDGSYVSAQHAQIRWVGDTWELRDLASRNGTFANGIRLEAGQAVKLGAGHNVAFGRATDTWELIDDSPPRVMVVPLDGASDPIFADGEILPLPSQDDPTVTLFHGANGIWNLEREDAIVPLVSLQVFEVAGRLFRFSSPHALADTSTLDWPHRGAVSLADVRLEFRVSHDEEYVEIYASVGKERHDVGTRSHNYLLLTLARQRLKDAESGVPDTACGWMDREDLVDGLRISTEQLNLDVFRIRKSFLRLGVVDPAAAVQRRPVTKQLRIGVSSLHIERI
jgi:FHA domain